MWKRRAKAAGSYPHLGHTRTPRSRRVPHTTQDGPREFVTSRKKPTIPRTNQVNGSRHLVLGMTLPPRIDAIGVDRWSGLIERLWDRQLRERLAAIGPAPRAELLHVLMLPDFERAERIGEFWGYPQAVPPSTDSSRLP